MKVFACCKAAATSRSKLKKVGFGSRWSAGMIFSSLAPENATSPPITRKRIRQLRSNSRCPAGTFSSSTNMESLERLVFHHQVGNGNRLGDRFLGNLAIPLADDFIPGQAVFELFQDDPHHDACALKRRLAAADFRVGHDVTAQFDESGSTIRLRLHVSAMDYAAARAGLQDNAQPWNGAGAAGFV